MAAPSHSFFHNPKIPSFRFFRNTKVQGLKPSAGTNKGNHPIFLAIVITTLLIAGCEQNFVKDWDDESKEITAAMGVVPDSLRSIHLVRWNKEAEPRELKTVEALMEARSNGEIATEETGIVINIPVLVWPVGHR